MGGSSPNSDRGVGFLVLIWPIRVFLGFLDFLTLTGCPFITTPALIPGMSDSHIYQSLFPLIHFLT